MEEIISNEKFKNWACSLSGCDGGYLKAGTWLCGIEWGAGSYDEGVYYREILRKEIELGAYSPSEDYEWKKHLDYTFGRSFAKIYSVIEGGTIEKYREFVLARGHQDIFKLNLYPIAFDSTDYQLWHQYGLDKITGFKEKHLYQFWCMLHRFPYFAELVKEHEPKLVIGTGVSYLKEFMMFFGGLKVEVAHINFADIHPKSEANQTPRRYYWTKLNGGKTTVVVIPFLSGRYGLNSDYLLEQMGIAIKKII